MQEDFLHYLYKHKKFNISTLKTTAGETIVIRKVGVHNHNTGPDFFNAQITIGGQLWAGNVELHIKSSDWFLHGHETDSNYDNVILHVVWEDDTEVFRKDNTQLPTLELKNYIEKETFNNYQKLFNSTQKWINCENDFTQVDDFALSNWLERLFFERLEQKSLLIEELLETSKNNWEAVLFKLLAKNFGLKVNSDSFLSVANSFDFSIVRKQQSKLDSLEALFFGQANLLNNDDIQEPYYQNLQKEYSFLKQKFGMQNNGVVPLQFFRLRPPNFPTIRLSQLANLYHSHQNVFSKIMTLKTLHEFYNFFNITASSFWETHYTFGKTSKASKKKLTSSFIDLLLINTIIPLKFAYARHQNQLINEELLSLIQTITSEKNSIINKFNSLKSISKSAMESQALLQLKNNYCDKNKCLQCAIGNAVLYRN